MTISGLHRSFQHLGGILLALLAFGCTQSKIEIGNYSGTFYWQNGLKEANLNLESDGHERLDLGNRDICTQLESIIQKKIQRANVSTARGAITVGILGGPPFLVSLKKIEIKEPNLLELEAYVESENADEIRRFVGRYNNVNQQDIDDGGTALFDAAAGAKLKAIQVLLALGCRRQPARCSREYSTGRCCLNEFYGDNASVDSGRSKC